ncbi:MAG: TIGR03435 family protein [Bryobacteraceae bacterium]
MKRIYMTLPAMVGGLVASLCFAQQPAFDAASVKAVDPSAPPPLAATGGPGTNDPGRIHFGRASMVELLMRAYDVPVDQVAGPKWIFGDLMGSNSYVIDATMPPGTTKEQFRLMLQNLLAQRFHLTVHHETQNFPGYDLAVAKDGPRLKESRSAPAPAVASGAKPPVIDKDGFPILPPGPQTFTIQLQGAQRVKYQERSMAQFAYNLRSKIALGLGADLAANLGTKKPRVRDKTGLTGKYDFILEFSCESCGGPGSSRSRRERTAASGCSGCERRVGWRSAEHLYGGREAARTQAGESEGYSGRCGRH